MIYDRILKVLTEKFEDQRGFIDLEAYYKFLVEAHSKTGKLYKMIFHTSRYFSQFLR